MFVTLFGSFIPRNFIIFINIHQTFWLCTRINLYYRMSAWVCCVYVTSVCANVIFYMDIHPLLTYIHDDVIKWKYFPRYWPFVRGIHRSPVNSPHKGQWRGTLMSSLISGRINGWVNNREASDLRRHRGHYDVNVMYTLHISASCRKIALFIASQRVSS